MQIFTARATPLPKPDRAVPALDAGPKAGLLVGRIDNRLDVMRFKVPVRRQQSGIRVPEPNCYLAGNRTTKSWFICDPINLFCHFRARPNTWIRARINCAARFCCKGHGSDGTGCRRGSSPKRHIPFGRHCMASIEVPGSMKGSRRAGNLT